MGRQLATASALSSSDWRSDLGGTLFRDRETQHTGPMRVLVCGGRGTTPTVKHSQRFWPTCARRGIAYVIAGGARGADTLAAEWADEHDVFLLGLHG